LEKILREAKHTKATAVNMPDKLALLGALFRTAPLGDLASSIAGLGISSAVGTSLISRMAVGTDASAVTALIAPLSKYLGRALRRDSWDQPSLGQPREIRES